MANFITGIRIFCSFALIFCKPLSWVFYVFYITAGISDMIDGTVARKTGKVSEFGSKMDSVADFILITICCIKLLPIMNLSVWLYIWIAVIAIIKLINIVFGFILFKKLKNAHTVMNKVVGGLTFVLPLTISFIDLKYSATVVCFIATLSAIIESMPLLVKKTDKK